MEFTSLYFHFTGPLHIGNHRSEDYASSEDFLRSDTIVAAVLSAWARMGQEQWIADYIHQPDFTISSAFPFMSYKGQKIHFLPKPKVPWQLQSFDADRSKSLKKARWIDSEYFEMMLLAEPIHSFGTNDKHLRGDYVSKHPIAHPIVAEVQDRVSVSRSGEEDAKPYVFERMHFADGAGLYMLVRGEMERLKIALNFLQEEGFGTDRSVGNGSFTLTEGELALDVPESDMSMNLGLYYASNKEDLQQQLNEYSTFSLVKRGGWITTAEGMGYEKNNVYMIEEGSVLALTDPEVGKHDIDLTPEIMQSQHPIYRSGRSLFIPIKTKPDE